MPNTPNGDPSVIQDGHSPQPVEPAAAPAPEPSDNAAGAKPSDAKPTDYLRDFLDAGGNLDTNKIANEIKSKKELEQLYGRQTNELGQLRQEVQQYGAFYQSEYVEDPDRPGQAIHRSVLEARQRQRGPQPIEGQLTEAEVAERLRDLLDENPLEYNRVILETAKREILSEINQRESVYTNPAAQKVLTDYPDVRPRAEQISLETGVPLERALKEAVGEKLLQIAGGGGVNPQPRPNINLGRLTTPSRTFMSPHGTTPLPKKESRLTPAQIERAREYGFSPEELEPFADPQEA